MNALVLIADADPEGLEHVRRLVEREGAVTVAARDSCEAMSLFVRREPLVTVLRVAPLHDLDLRVCRDMKNLRIGRRRLVVVVGPRDSRSAAFDSGCDAFVAYDTDGLSFRRTVRRLLAVARRSSPAEAEAEIELIA